MKGVRIIIQTLEENGGAPAEPIIAAYREILTEVLVGQKVGIKTALKIIADDLVDKFTDDIILLGKFDDVIK